MHSKLLDRMARSRGALALAILSVFVAGAARGAPSIVGTVTDANGAGIAGAMLTFRAGNPAHSLSVTSAADGQFQSPALESAGPWDVRARRIGWKDLHVTALAREPEANVALVLERENDPAQVAAQLPANQWYALVLAKLDDPSQREELKRQCTYCHQQGSAATRVVRPSGAHFLHHFIP